MNNSSDRDQELQEGASPSAEHGVPPQSTRRRFTRNALMGSVVAVSLGNRTAWGVEHCMSASILASYVAAGNMFASAQPDHDADLAAEIIRLRDLGGSDGVNQLCPEPTQTCVVPEGDCPDTLTNSQSTDTTLWDQKYGDGTLGEDIFTDSAFGGSSTGGGLPSKKAIPR